MLKQGFDRRLVRDVNEYHDWHGDTKVELKGFVCDPAGEPLLWTRAVDENKHKVSTLLSFTWNGLEEKFNIHEVEGGPRENENCMLCSYMNSNEWGDEDG